MEIERMIFIPLLLLLHIGTPRAEGNQQRPPDVSATLEAAGENRRQLEKVIEHYTNDTDTLKLQAAYYLIANMEGHSYVRYGLYDTLGQEYDYNVLDYPDLQTLQQAFDSLEILHGTLDFQRKDTTYDVNSITADFLIGHIDLAFRAWREKPWAKSVSFDTFCRYILPYRGSNEPLENWRTEFWKKYHDIPARMSDSTDPIEATAFINDDIMSWFKFNERFYYHPTDQGLKDMLTNRMGRCEDMTNLTIYALRANGLAVTSDYTPHWANTGNNHAWNSIVTPEGEVIPFMGAEANPGEYQLANKAAKVYRKTFGKQPQNLAFLEHKQEKIPRWLSGKSYVDVTRHYVAVSDIAFSFEKDVPDSVDIAYLCVFNSGEWRPIHWGKVVEGVALFTDMGTDVAYLPALYLNEEVVPWGPPFILGADSAVSQLIPVADQPASVRLVSTTRRKLVAATDGVEKVFLESGKVYELYIWNENWQSLGTARAGNEPLVFDSVPSGALFWLKTEGSDGEHERIFTVENGQQVWW